MGKYLKSHQHYSDLYDRHTVEQCRRTEESSKNRETDPPESKKVTREQAVKIKSAALQWYLHVETGERYLNKATRIQEWMDADKKRDDLLENAQAPDDIRCLTCRSRLKPTYTHLWTELDKEDRVLFMYDCPNNCLPRRSFFSDGEELRSKPDLCPKCEMALKKEITDDGKKIITTLTCPKCKYTNTDEYVWTHKKEDEVDENFATDRDRFCLTDEEGEKYRQEKFSLEQLGKLMEEFKETDNKRAEKLKENPKGFHLDGAGYTCFICGNSTPEGDNWYNEYGIKCLVCQKAIDGGEIPASLAKDKDSWYSKWELGDRFNLESPTLRKWIKEGIIKARTVSNFGKGVHVELFLLEDNKKFLPPKKLVESQTVAEKKDGKTWHRMEPWYRFVDPFKYLKGYGIMKHMRVVPPEEVAAREAEEKRRWEEKRKKSEEMRARRGPLKRKKRKL